MKFEIWVKDEEGHKCCISEIDADEEMKLCDVCHSIHLALCATTGNKPPYCNKEINKNDTL